MTISHALYHRFQRSRSLRTHVIRSLPVLVLMPHSGCNCRCIMCDIWKDNGRKQQLKEEEIAGLLVSLRRLGTQQVLLSGGEALLHPGFFSICSFLKKEGIRVTLLTAGLSLEKYAASLVECVDDIIVSLDGDAALHNEIRNIPDAFEKMAAGIQALRAIQPAYRVSGRSVIHRVNFRRWPQILEAARQLQLDQISFLPADISSHAFNREVLWTDQRQQELLPAPDEMRELKEVLDQLIREYSADFACGFIAESPEKLRKIFTYYAALHGWNPFPDKKCNAPWVSAVLEADGQLRPCFFHEAMGNIREQGLEDLLNSDEAIAFRKNLDIMEDPVCKKCVCYLHLSPGTRLNKK